MLYSWPKAGMALHYVFRLIINSVCLQRFCLQHHDGSIRVWRHREEYMLPACMRHRRSGPLLEVLGYGVLLDTCFAQIWFALMVLWTVSLTFRCVMPLALSFIRTLQNATYQQVNAWPHVAAIVSWYRKCLTASLAFLFSRFLTNRKHQVYDCRATGSSLYGSHYCLWTAGSCWCCMVSSTCTCHSLKFSAQAYNSCYF